jgi:hypothetical protein
MKVTEIEIIEAVFFGSAEYRRWPSGFWKEFCWEEGWQFVLPEKRKELEEAYQEYKDREGES